MKYSWRKIKDARLIDCGQQEFLVEWQAHGGAPPRADSWEGMKAWTIEKQIFCAALRMTRAERAAEMATWEQWSKHAAKWVHDDDAGLVRTNGISCSR